MTNSGNAELSGAQHEELRRLFALLRRTGLRGTTRDPGRLEPLVTGILELSGTRARGTGTGTGNLTAREVDVLALTALGSRNRDTADHLGISPETVKSYLRSAMAKLGVHSRHAAVEVARERNLIP